MVNQGTNKCLTYVSVMENYEVGYDKVMEYYNTLRNSNIELKMHMELKIRLNNDNIVDVQNLVFQVSIESLKF